MATGENLKKSCCRKGIELVVSYSFLVTCLMGVYFSLLYLVSTKLVSVHQLKGLMFRQVFFSPPRGGGGERRETI